MIPGFSVNFASQGPPNNDDNRCEARMTRRAIICLGLASCYPVFRDRIVPSVQASQESEGTRSDERKRTFASQMETRMVVYEASVADEKKDLFSMISKSDTVAEVGMGTGPNLRFLPRGVHVIGIEPNQFMWPYAREKANEYGVDLQLVDAVSEDIPLKSNSCDYVISTLTLCSVKNPSAAMQEIHRILKPGGALIFIEHVSAPMSRPILRIVQNILNPIQMMGADGCHLNRETTKLLSGPQSPGFSEVKFKEVDVDFGVPDFLNPMRPQLAGYARK